MFARMAFGKRTRSPGATTQAWATIGDAARAPDPPPAAGSEESSPTGLLGWLNLNDSVLIKVGGSVLAVLALQFVPEWIRPAPKDLTPGAPPAAIEPYVRPDGCPSHSWQVGDFLPAACVVNFDTAHRGETYGLAYPRRMRRQLKRQMWVRVERDALGVACPSGHADCLIRTVVHDRFTGPPTPNQPAPRRLLGLPSASYAGALTLRAGIPLFIVMGLIGIAALVRRTSRDPNADWAAKVRLPGAPGTCP